jgi:hypothetical protein
MKDTSTVGEVARAEGLPEVIKLRAQTQRQRRAMSFSRRQKRFSNIAAFAHTSGERFSRHSASNERTADENEPLVGIKYWEHELILRQLQVYQRWLRTSADGLGSVATVVRRRLLLAEGADGKNDH